MIDGLHARVMSADDDVDDDDDGDLSRLYVCTDGSMDG
jgi:hypothetical protein